MNTYAVMYGAIAGMAASVFFVFVLPESLTGAVAAFMLCAVAWVIAAIIERRRERR